jgi:hypothetical protein
MELNPQPELRLVLKPLVDSVGGPCFATTFVILQPPQSVRGETGLDVGGTNETRGVRSTFTSLRP